MNPVLDDELQRNPNQLTHQIEAKKDVLEWVIIDEVQKNYKLLDIVHYLIESTSIKFALTGSSARKLKRGSANLLAGRAFQNYLFPLTAFEMGPQFDLDRALHWGTLPTITQLNTNDECADYLRSYALTYLKEEIWAEHIIRNLDPFRRFLGIAAQSNGEIINYSNIAYDVGVDVKTVQSYFEILEDTLIGFCLEPYHQSVRKQQRQNPKFYFFDLGVKRALQLQLNQPLSPSTSEYGNAFEHFIVTELFRLNHYLKMDLKFYYLRTKDNAEIDLIIEYPNKSVYLIEIKSSDHVDERHIRTLKQFLPSFPNAKGMVVSRENVEKKIDDIDVLPWKNALEILCLNSIPPDEKPELGV